MKSKSCLLFVVLIPIIINAQWIKTNGPSGGYINCFAVQNLNNGKIIYAGSYTSGIAKSSDLGNTWIQINSGLKQLYISGITANDSTVFAGTQGGGGIYKSTNNGDSWIESNTGLDNTYIMSLTCIGNIIFAGTNHGVYRSINNGNLWGKIGLDNEGIISLLVNNSALYAATISNGIYYSENLGKTWQKNNTGLTNPFISSLAANGSNLFAATWNFPYHNGVYLSTNKGENWSSIGLVEKEILAVEIRGNTLYASSYNDGVYSTSDFGRTWLLVNDGLFDTKIRAMICVDNTILVGSELGGIYILENSSQMWKQAIIPFAKILSLTSSGETLYAGVAAKGIFYSTNNGDTWTPSNLNNVGVNAILINGPNIFAASGGIFQSKDFGHSWFQTSFPNYTVYSLAINNKGIFAGGTNGIYTSTDSGITWGKNSFSGGEVSSLFADNTTILAGTRFLGILRSTDFGSSWIQCMETDGAEITSIIKSDNTIFASTKQYGIYKSVNNGVSWSKVFYGGWPALCIASVGSNLFSGTGIGNSGVFFSENSSPTWKTIGMQGYRINAITVFNNYVFVGTENSSVWRCPISEIITDIDKEVLPDHYSLSQNYPNPFNPSTTIDYQLSTPGFVTLKVYDLLGREVATLVDEYKQAGFYNYKFSIINFQLTSGVYFYRLQAGSFSETKKLILMK